MPTDSVPAVMDVAVLPGLGLALITIAAVLVGALLVGIAWSWATDRRQVRRG